MCSFSEFDGASERMNCIFHGPLHNNDNNNNTFYGNGNSSKSLELREICFLVYLAAWLVACFAIALPCLCSSARVHAHSFTLFILPVQTGDAMYAQVH